MAPPVKERAIEGRGIDGRETTRRGTPARGTANRIATPIAPPQDYPPFDVRLLGFFGQAAIPDALAYALKWQIELDRQQAQHPEPTEAQQELAEHLLAVFDFLLLQEQQVQRDLVDGALLYRDPLKQYAATPLRNPRLVAIDGGSRIPVTDEAPYAPLPVWAPRIFPREFGGDSRSRYPARPRTLIEIPPFDSPLMLAGWLRLRNWRPPTPIAPTRTAGVITPPTPTGTTLAAEPRPPKPVDKKALDDTLNQAVARYDAHRAAAEASPPYTRTPLVNNVIRQLSSYTLADLRTATDANVQSRWADDKLIAHTKVILYHSVFTVVLDQAGNPFDLRYTPGGRGLLDYALLVPEPGSQMQRALPNAGGVTVSVQRYGDTTFRIEQGKIRKVLFGGVGSFAEVGYGYTGKHPLQETIEHFVASHGTYIASASVEAAFHPAEADLSRIYLRLYDLAEAATPHVIEEVKARLKYLVRNWQEILEEVVWEAIKNVVIDEIREHVKQYVIKKVGQRLVPVVNAGFALYDLAAGSAARTRMRYAIACAMLAVKGTTEEDTELAARVVSKIVADEFNDKIIEALTRAASHAGRKVIRRPAGKPPSDSPTKTPPPAKQGAHDEPTPTTAQPAAPPPQVYESAADAEARRQANEYVRQKMAEAMQSATHNQPPAKATKTKPHLNDATEDTAADKTNHGTRDTSATHPGAAGTKSASRGTEGSHSKGPEATMVGATHADPTRQGVEGASGKQNPPGHRTAPPRPPKWTETGFSQPQLERLLDAPGSGFKRATDPKTGEPISEPGFWKGKPLQKGRAEALKAGATYPDIFGIDTATGRQVAMEMKVIPQGESVLGHFGKQEESKRILSQHAGRIVNLPPGTTSYLVVDLRMTKQNIDQALEDLSKVTGNFSGVGQAKGLWDGVRFITGTPSDPNLSDIHAIP
jgi:ribulose-5-phosphate 4-epimerase/fuculose-1-phosphate aldolase